MDKTLKGLFGYQKFEGNRKLDKLIAETESRVGMELNEEELDMVNAAGTRGVQGNYLPKERGIGNVSDARK